MDKVCTLEAALSHINPELPIMISGFVGCGAPDRLVRGMLDRGFSDLEVVANDAAFPDKGVGRLIAAGRIRSFTTCHIGTNPEAGPLWQSGDMKVILSPQGTLVEQIRCGGAGLGGVLSPVGLGTVVEEDRRVITVEGKRYLLHPPLRADVALIKAHKGDRMGNLVYRRTARNYNTTMATAARLVIAEVDHLVEVGDLDPDEVMTPGVFVDYVVPPEEVE